MYYAKFSIIAGLVESELTVFKICFRAESLSSGA
jgi:hypothetical protein